MAMQNIIDGLTPSRLCPTPYIQRFPFVSSVINILMAIQVQLYEGYKGDKYLRDRLDEAIDIPTLKCYLKDRPARSSQQLINWVAKKLSDRPRTEGSAYASGSTDHQADEGREECHYGLYTLGQRYGGGAKKHTNSFVWRPGNGRTNPHGNNFSRTWPSWMKDSKSCFVCRKPHMVNAHHSR